MKKIIKLILPLVIGLTLCSCGTIMSLTKRDYRVYAGVSNDFEIIREGGLMSVFAVVDLPLSFVLDSLLLPVTLTH